jgi:NAD(P)-dependent dehydrogenase (short-subunit alcohol dehydrogenase family)
VTQPESIQAARVHIGTIMAAPDVLINNAGISGGMPQSVREVTPEQFQAVLATTVFGTADVTPAVLDLQPRVVNVTTAIASLAMYADFDNSALA